MTSSRWSEPLTQTEPKGGTQMELSACIVVYNGAGDDFYGEVRRCLRGRQYRFAAGIFRRKKDAEQSEEYLRSKK